MTPIDYEYEYGKMEYTVLEGKEKSPCPILDEYNESADACYVTMMKSQALECEARHRGSYYIECSDDCPFWKYWHK